MHYFITEDQKKELKQLKEFGTRKTKKYRLQLREEILGLIVLKYLLYTGIKTWRQGNGSPFSSLDLSIGHRRRGVGYLHKMKVVEKQGHRWICESESKLLELLKKMEKEEEVIGF